MATLADYLAEEGTVTDALADRTLSQLQAATIISGEVSGFVLWHDEEKRWYMLDSQSGIWQPALTSDTMQLEIDEILLRFSSDSKKTDSFSSAVTRALSRRLSMPGSTFDGDPWVLGVQNGVVELRTGYLRPASPNRYVTKQCPVEYDDDATCPRWTEHLTRLFEGDGERVSWFQQAVGASLVGRASEKDQIFIYVLGPPGNGKGTTMRTLIATLGQDQYAANINPADLVRDRHLAWMHRLKGRRLAVIEEVKSAKIDVSKLKSLTGGDTIVANRMRQEDEAWEPSHTLFMTANHAPVLDDISGMQRRYRPVQTGPSIDPSELSTFYEDELRAEREGILAWAVRGCLMWQQNGQRLEQLDCSRALAEEHLADNDQFLEWGERHVSLEPGWSSRQEVIGSYNWWAASRSLPPLTTTGQRQLYEWLRSRGAHDDRRAAGRGFTGIKVVSVREAESVVG